MIIYICAFTEKGSKVAEEIMAAMPEHIFCNWKKGIITGRKAIDERAKEIALSEFVEDGFGIRAPLIFVGACGIAVRSIAPYVSNKLYDSPVIVIDEMKEYVIPLLSGHIGGANELAIELADLLDARPVITTATDVNDTFSVDVWAKKMGLAVYNKSGIARVSSNILAGQKLTLIDRIGFGEELASLPESIEVMLEISKCMVGDNESENNASETDEQAADVAKSDVVISEDCYDAENCSLLLIPKRICLGIGCRKGTELVVIEKQVALALSELADLYQCPLDNIYDCIYGVASIDLKAKEYGLNAFAQKIGTRLVTFSADELMSLEGDFTESEFVEQVTGVSNVCERAAVLLAKMSGGYGRRSADKQGSEGRLHADRSDSAGRMHTDKVGLEGRLHAAKSDSVGKLLVRKIASDGVTVAIALR